MLEAAWDGLLHLGRWLLIYLLWERTLFHLGYITLWLLTLGRWHSYRKAGQRSDWISAAGLLPLLALWVALAMWNNRHG
ncbi:hypothetical protein [Dyella sp.]|uniref:hypothetical protein n=1 Tax=Dyella sp. TaxID=1869338 RepID=UPI003F7DE43E